MSSGQSQAPNGGTQASSPAASTIPSRGPARRRNADSAPSLADLRSSSGAGAQGPARSRVQQTSAAAASSDGSPSKGVRTRLMPLAAAAAAAPPESQQQNQAAAASTAAAPRRITGLPSQLFSVFTNPLSASGQAGDSNSSGQASRSRAAASIQAASESPEPQQQQDHGAAGPHSAAGEVAAAADPSTVTAAAAAGADQAPSTSYTLPAGIKMSQQQDGLQQTYRFEVQAAGSEPEQLVDYNGHDQHTAEQMFGPDGKQMQQLGGSIQQYVYDEDTGQLCRTGEGAETTRLGRHYLEDCHTGEFFQLAQQPTSSLWAWIRRRPHLGADGWFQRSGAAAAAADGLQQQEPAGCLNSLSDFLDTMGSAMAALGLFSQGLAGGLALLCLFMTYIQYATAGREGFLAFYSPQAEMVNRTFFTLISISLVAAAARHAYDQLGNFCPRRLKLGVVDSCVMLLYFLAYTCNLLATPLDDQLAFEARRDPAFYELPLPAAFESRLGIWHGLNLVRVVACGLAWVLVCYRSNHFVMLRVFEARREEQEEEEQRQQLQGYRGGVSGSGGAQGVAARVGGVGAGVGGGADASRRLVRMGSNLGSFGNRASAGGAAGVQQQQQWAVPSKRFSSSEGAAAGGAGGVGAWGPDQRG